MKTNYYFASANTSKGFVNHFDYINTTENYYRYVIKGSSGCGKSTLMKKIADNFKEKSDIEFFYCSSDPSSLDGIRLVNYDVSIIDGTSPHATEAKIPSVVDEIVNLGEFINNDVKFYKDKITEILSLKSKNYSKIYALLSAIGYLDNCIRENYENFSEKDIEKCILDNCSYSHKKPQIRKLFLSALDENGIIDYTEKNSFKQIFLPVNKYEFSSIIMAIKEKILQKGNDITLFYDLFSPENIVSILINGKTLYTYTKELPLTVEEEKIKGNINSITSIASSILKNTRKMHFELEKIYSDFIDFNGLNTTYEKIKSDIEKRIDKIN